MKKLFTLLAISIFTINCMNRDNNIVSPSSQKLTTDYSTETDASANVPHKFPTKSNQEITKQKISQWKNSGLLKSSELLEMYKLFNNDEILEILEERARKIGIDIKRFYLQKKPNISYKGGPSIPRN